MSCLKPVTVALVLATVAAGPSFAAVVGVSLDVNLSDGPYTFALPEGAGSYTFGNSGQSGFFGFLPAVATTGTATVASLGAPFFAEPRPTTYFTDEGRRPFFDATTLALYVGYADPAVIDAQTDSYIGLRFTLADGDHFGFARLAGLSLTEFAYETQAGVGIAAGPGPYAPIPAAVPLPAGLPLLAGAIAVLAGFRLRRRA